MNKKELGSEIVDFLKDLVWIVIIVLVVRSFIAEPFQISGQSMADSYYDKEFIIIDRFSYLDIPWIKLGNIDRWDVVVFKPWVSDDKQYFIKRVIWIPWDTIKIEGGEVFLKPSSSKEFVKLNEKYLNDYNNWNTKIGGLLVERNYRVPEWEYFVMGDNRNHSSDSRTCFSFSCSSTSRDSFINKKEIIGKLFLDLGYFNIRNFSFKHSWNSKHPSLEWLDTSPRWFSSPWTYDYGL